MRTFTFPRALVAGAALFTAAEACVQAHNYMYNDGTGDDVMTMEVYVDGHVVCFGGEREWFASGDTEFCLRNHDGKGTGCAPGYVYCTKNNGRTAYINYYEDEKVIWNKTFGLNDTESGNPDCGERTCHDVESCLQVQDIECPVDSCEMCDRQSFCNGDDIDPPVPFPYPPAPPAPEAFKAMIVGDSISHGMEGDFTWRWRIFYWLQDVLGLDVDFVGPWKGVKGAGLRVDARPQPPLLPGESAPELEELTGYYNGLVPASFSTTAAHAAKWGRQAAESKGAIQAWVQEYQPDYLLVLLGFNDLGWFVNGPEGLLSDMKALVDNARKGKSDVKILLGNVVDRNFITGRQDLVENTVSYNKLLRESVGSWSLTESPVLYVDVNTNYNCRPEGCPDGWDGLHPNSLGEYHIAEAFAKIIKEYFQFDGPDFEVPSDPEPRVISTPANVRTMSVPEGLRTDWDFVSGARGYDLRSRLKGMDGWWSEGPASLNAAGWSTWVVSGQTWEFQVRTRGDNDNRSEWSAITSATADVKTAPGPPNIVVVPSGEDGLQIRWGAVTGYDVNRYSVIIWDRDTEGAFIEVRGISDTSLLIGGLVQNHRYSIWVDTWVNLDGHIAGGLPVAGRDVLVGGRAPAPPGNLNIMNVDATTVEINWDASAGASGYGVYVYPLLNSATNAAAEPEPEYTPDTTHSIALLFPGTWNYKFCVSAFNGNLESSATDVCVVPPVYPGFENEKREEVEDEGDDEGDDDDGTVVTHTSVVYDEITMVEDEDLATVFSLLAVQASEDDVTPISDNVVDV